MDEAKAAAYYDELARKGEGAARFKQGLGFSSPTSNPLPKPSSSLSASFVRASSPSKAAELHKQAQLQNIHNKLNTVSDRGHRSRHQDDRRSSERRSERDRNYRDEEGGGRRERSHGRSSRSRSRSPSWSRSRSPSRRRDSLSHKREKEGSQRRELKNKRVDVDYSKLIEGYSEMTPAERVKAKMKFQLSQTAAKDTAMGMSTGWERFDFNKDAPLDGDDEIEVAEDDALVVKAIGKSFRSSAAEAKREEDIKAAHDQAMFGAPTGSPVVPEIGSNQENDSSDIGPEILKDNLISDKMFATQQGSWRDRVRRFQNSSGK